MYSRKSDKFMGSYTVYIEERSKEPIYKPIQKTEANRLRAIT